MLTILLAALLAAPAGQDVPVTEAAGAADEAQHGAPPQRVRSILLYGDEKCPKAAAEDEIVVCAHAGDSPYRIPEALREPPPDSGASASWVRRVEVMDEVNRIGLPGSCSPVGTGGQTGCTLQLLQQWTAEKQDKARHEPAAP